MKLTKRGVQKRVLKDGKPLSLKLFDWYEESRTFVSEVYGLVIDFTGIDNVKFKTGYASSFTTGFGCTFDTGNMCMFKTGGNCVFNTGNGCIFNTPDDCTFVTGYGCTFDTGSDCTFDTGDSCMFNTIDKCKFKTTSYCTFNTREDCSFITRDNCDFKTGNDCTFDTGSGCVFNTSYGCTFDTDCFCTFDTGSDCTFDTSAQCSFITRNNCTFVTGSDCVFITNSDCDFYTGSKCVIITKPHSVVINPPIETKLTTCPMHTPGYLIGNDYYVNDVKQDGEYIIADGILSKIVSKKDNVYKVHNYNDFSDSFSTTPTYIVQDGDLYSHGDTVKEARESLIYKISNRDTSVYNNLTIDSVLSKEEAIKMYRVITGACAFGVRRYVESLTDVKDSYSIQEIIELTNGLYGNDVLRDFFKI